MYWTAIFFKSKMLSQTTQQLTWNKREKETYEWNERKERWSSFPQTNSKSRATKIIHTPPVVPMCVSLLVLNVKLVDPARSCSVCHPAESLLRESTSGSGRAVQVWICFTHDRGDITARRNLSALPQSVIYNMLHLSSGHEMSPLDGG